MEGRRQHRRKARHKDRGAEFLELVHDGRPLIRPGIRNELVALWDYLLDLVGDHQLQG